MRRVSRRPLIGITSYAQPARWGAWELPAALVPLYYVESVERAGGRALVVPPSTEAVDETLDVLDGVVFSGGRYDVGSKIDFLRANVELALERPELAAELGAFLADLVRRRGLQ